MWSMPRIGGCPDERSLSRAFSRGAEGALARHLESCPRCQGQWQVLERLRSACRQLPIPPLSAEAAERIRFALVNHSTQRIRRAEGWRRPLLVLCAAGLSGGGQLDQAAALFRNAVADGVTEVERSAVAGLAEVIRRANARVPEGR
jgi:hypothetical protein